MTPTVPSPDHLAHPEMMKVSGLSNNTKYTGFVPQFLMDHDTAVAQFGDCSFFCSDQVGSPWSPDQVW
jgi:hypothetical protein